MRRSTVEPSAKIGGSLTSFAEGLGLEGSVGRDVLAFFAHGSLAGKVGGSVRAKGDSLVIGSTAVIDGPVRFEGTSNRRCLRQQIGFPIEFKYFEKKQEYRESDYYIWRVIWTAAFVLFGMVLFLLIPKFAGETISAAESYGAPIGLGILVFSVYPLRRSSRALPSLAYPWQSHGRVLDFDGLLRRASGGGGGWQFDPRRTTDTWGTIGRMALGSSLCESSTHRWGMFMCWDLSRAGNLDVGHGSDFAGALPGASSGDSS